MAFQTLRPMSLDWRGELVAVLLALASTCTAALGPLSWVCRALPASARHGRFDHPTSTTLRSTLVAGQIAVTLIVLTAAALLARGFIRLHYADVGYDANGLLSVSVALRGDGFNANAAKQQFLEDLRRTAAEIPGVLSATVTESIPPQMGLAAGMIHTDNGLSIPELATTASVDDAFFRTMRIPMLRGTLQTAARATDARRPAVVSKSLAAVAWREQDPIERVFRISGADGSYVVTGVAGDVHNGSFEAPLAPFAVYEPRSVQPDVWQFQSLVVRTSGDIRGVERAIREIVKRLNPKVTVTNVDMASALIVDMNARVQFATWLMIGFASVATLLALIGVFGAFSCAVRQRAREIAVRLALGAEPRQVVRMILAASGRCAILGVAVGLPVAVALSLTLRSLLVATSPVDPLTYLAVGTMLVSAAIGAAWYPAVRASQLDPANLLRAE